MFKITFFKKKHFYQLEAKGHTGFDDEGLDIVCAAVSALLQNTLVGLKYVLKAKNKTIKKKGYFLFTLLEGLNSPKIEKSQLLINTLYKSLRQIAKQHPGLVKVTIRRQRSENRKQK